MDPTPQDVLAVVSRQPRSIGDVGLAIAAAYGHDPATAEGQPVGQWLAALGLSLSAVQKVVDQLVRDGQVVEVKGAQLWALELPTEGTKAQGRYYLSR
ncbi:MAG: hypothetical protein JWN87_949 [Frankiales bacterium]|jgi:hypothetical protein|nr:hypothetical protein [Frankiales bacterium]MCW2586877.1 hypothetical protein [Frankiales bacterium]